MKKIILMIAILLSVQTAIAVESDNGANNFQQNINVDLDDDFVKALTFEDFTKSMDKDTNFIEDFQNATIRYKQTNVVAAYKDFSKIVGSMDNKNDYLYLTMALRLNNLGFFTLGQSALINIEDTDLWYPTIDFIKRMYNPAVTLTYDEEIYLSQLLTATLYNNSAKETIKTLENNEKILKKSDYANYVLAVAYFENKNYSKSLSYINKAISRSPECLNYIHFKEKIYSEIGDYKNALKIIKALEQQTVTNNYSKDLLNYDKYYILMKINKKDKSKYYGAKLLFMQKDNQKAIKEAQSAISLNKKNLDAYVLLGDHYIEAKNPEKALEYYQNALTINKKFAPAIRGLGHYYFVKKDYKKSLEYYQNAYKYSTQDEQLLLCLANNYLIFNDKENANLYLGKVLKMNPNSDGAYYLMSRLVPEMKEAYLRKSIKLNAVNTHAWYDLAELKLNQKNYKKAEEYVFPLIILEPQSPKNIHLQKLIKMKGNLSLKEKNSDDTLLQTIITPAS